MRASRAGSASKDPNGNAVVAAVPRSPDRDTRLTEGCHELNFRPSLMNREEARAAAKGGIS